jgi:hypothetical protein
MGVDVVETRVDEGAGWLNVGATFGAGVPFQEL